MDGGQEQSDDLSISTSASKNERRVKVLVVTSVGAGASRHEELNDGLALLEDSKVQERHSIELSVDVGHISIEGLDSINISATDGTNKRNVVPLLDLSGDFILDSGSRGLSIGGGGRNISRRGKVGLNEDIDGSLNAHRECAGRGWIDGS